ncbi:hypothetical protein ACJ41O_001378 [Fusarium nematophilum]
MAESDSENSGLSNWWDYLEYYCQICGVSFNLSRIRRPDEPFHNSWCCKDRDDWYLPRQESFVQASEESFANCRECFAGRRIPAREKDGETDGDGEYVYESDVETEPLEFTSPPESDGELCQDNPTSAIAPGSDEGGDDSHGSLDSHLESEEEYPSFITSLEDDNHQTTDELRCQQDQSNLGIWPDIQEHIAAKDCRCQLGYNGHRISAEEMQRSTTAQFLVPKRTLQSWKPEPDDEDFEKEGDYFLSGLVDRMGRKNDRHLPPVYPRRHDTSRPQGVNCLRNPGSAATAAMPFHPSCLEVFKRASLRRLGRVDIKALTDWYQYEATISDFFNFPRHPAVLRGREPSWRHCHGDEWLAANPCLDDRTKSFLGRMITKGTPLPIRLTGTAVDAVAEPLQQSEASRIPRHDPFSRLPIELRSEILSHLKESADVANLAQSSPAFLSIPAFAFKQLFVRNYPWIWETRCHLPFSFWSAKTASDIAKDFKLEAEQWARYEYWTRPVLGDERSNYEDDALEPAMTSLEQKIRARVRSDSQQPLEAFVLPNESVEWRLLFIQVTRNLDKLRGLRNRARIWDDCNFILDRIEMYTASGWIARNIVIDPVQVAGQYFAAHRDHYGPIYPH